VSENLYCLDTTHDFLFLVLVWKRTWNIGVLVGHASGLDLMMLREKKVPIQLPQSLYQSTPDFLFLKFGLFLTIIIVYFLKKTMLRHVSGFLLHQTSWAEFVKLELNLLKHLFQGYSLDLFICFFTFWKVLEIFFSFWHRKLTLKFRILQFFTTFTARLKTFLWAGCWFWAC
jgi:hypothetical protein